MNSPRLYCYRKGLGKAHIKFLPWSSGPGETSTSGGGGARRNDCIRRLISKQLFISQKRKFNSCFSSGRNTFEITVIVRCAKKYFLTLADTTDSPNTTMHNQQGVLFLLYTCLFQRAFFIIIIITIIIIIIIIRRSLGKS